MKILIVQKRWLGGVGSVVRYLKKEFEKLGHEVEVISRDDDLKIFTFAKSFFKLRNAVKKKKFDIVYTQDWSMTLPLIFPYHIFKKKHFAVFYGENPKWEGYGYYFQKLAGKIMGKNLVVCTDHLKQMFSKSNKIYNRVDHNTFKPDKKMKKIKNSVGYASWLTEEYSFPEIKKAVERAGKKFIIAENVPKGKMPEFYRKLECFITIPPHHAGFTLVYLEAMSSDVPKIVGTNFGGGSVIPITKIEDYQGDIAKAILNAKKGNYRKWILDKNLTWEDATKKLEKLFMGREK